MDLAEYAPNLRGSGVHGALMVRAYVCYPVTLVEVGCVTGCLKYNNNIIVLWHPVKIILTAV